VTFTCPKEMMVRSAESTLLSAVLTCLLLLNDKSFRRMCFNIASLNVMRHTALQNALLPTEVMRKYIEYARRYCNPVLTKAAAKVLPN
jgi:DNA replicative helicase MCM subunit Mcm2 (Cdc46/Mcm family)